MNRGNSRTIILSTGAGVLICGMVLMAVWRRGGVVTVPRPDVGVTREQAGMDSEYEVLRADQAEPKRVRASGPIVPLTEPVTAGRANGSIDTPQENESVPRTFHVTGRSGSLPEGSHLMLAVQTGRVFSPQMPPVDSSGQDWAGTCNEYGVPAGAAFTLCLFVVSEDGLQEIARWHTQGKATGSYPPFATVPGGALLAKLPLRVAKRNR